MNQAWTEFLVQQGLSAEGLDFGNRHAEVSAAQTASIITPLLDLGLIRASGPEAAGFLHNLLTNDIESLDTHPDKAVRAGFCTPKGRLLATFLVWRQGEDLLLALAADLHAAILKRLSMYILRSKVKLTDASQDFALLGLSGPAAEIALKSKGISPLPPLQSTAFEDGRLIGLSEQRDLLALPTPSAPAIWQSLSTQLRPAGLNAWRWLDIIAGLPHICKATQEEFTPQMVNYELVGGVSFKKGCYPGQEIVARTQYLGKVKRRMLRLYTETEISLPAPGTPIFVAATDTPDQAIGLVTAAAASPKGGHELLAVIPTSELEAPPGHLRLGQADGPTLLLQPLPYTV